MRLFSHENRQRNARTKRIYAAFEIAHTAADFGAAASFLVGSVLFFWQALETAAVWFFVVGSALFCLKPAIRMLREIKLASMGDTDDLAARFRP